MLMDVAVAEILLENGHLPVSLVQPDGTIVYENHSARQLLGHENSSAPVSLHSSLTVPSYWEEMLAKITAQGRVEDEAVLLQTLHGEAEVAYMTATPQYDSAGRLNALLCVWASHRKAFASSLSSTNTGTLSEYTRELEELLEHRTYQNLLSAEQNEFARDALDALTVGIMIVSREGDILYRNRAMIDVFGWQSAGYLRMSVENVFIPELIEAFRQTVANGLRHYRSAPDPGGRAAHVDLLPLLRAGTVQRVVVQFSRSEADV
jgi:PAS domain-containing protein